MSLPATRLVSWASSSKLTDTSRLCLGAATGFGIVGGGAWLASCLTSSESRLSGLMWVGCFYLALGLLDQLKATRFIVRTSIATASAFHDDHEMIEESRPSKVA